jgi:hypothetical protein
MTLRSGRPMTRAATPQAYTVHKTPTALYFASAKCANCGDPIIQRRRGGVWFHAHAPGFITCTPEGES